MASDISFGRDISRLITALQEMPDAVKVGGERALSDIKDDWILEARDVAPLDTGNLRRQMDGEIENNELVVSANAVNANHFNYAYYIHEQDAGGKSLRMPGTVKKFLDKSAAERTEDWLDWIEDEVGDELKRRGVVVRWQR